MSCNCGNNIKKTTCANHLTVDDLYRAVTLKDLEGYLKKDDYLKGWTATEQDIVRSNIGINEYRDLDDIYQLLIKRLALNDKDYIVINDADDDYKPKKVYIQDLFKYDDITFTSADDTITITETYDDTTRITTVDFSNPDHPQTLANTEAIELLQEKTDEIQDDLEATKTRVTTNERNIASLNSRQTIVEDRMAATEEDVADFKEEVRTKISCVYKFKGSVKNQYDLPPSVLHPEAPEIGDVWDIEEYSGDSPWHKAGDHWGMNVCWTGEEWDELGALVDHDIFEVIEHKVTDWQEYEGDVFEDTEHYPSIKAMAEYFGTIALPTYADTDSVSITENDGEVSADVNIVPLNNAISITDEGLYVEPRYTDSEIDLLLGAKADKATTYTKSEVDNALSTKANANSVYTKTEVDTVLETKADKATTYTKTEVDSALDTKADKATTYAKTEVDNLLNTKADKTTTYTKTEVGDLLNTKADKATTYTKTEVDTALETKADKTTTYTKTEVDEKIDELDDAIEDTNERIDDVDELLKSKVDKFQAYNSQDAHDVHYIAKTTKVVILDDENPTYTTQAEDQFGYGADIDSPVLEFVVNTSNAKIIMPYLQEFNDRQVVLAKVSKDSEYKTCAFDIVKSDNTVVHTLGLAYGEGARDAAGNGKYKAMLFARYINEGVEQTLRVATFGDSVALTKDASSIASINFTGKTTKWQRVATIRFDQDMKSIKNDFNIKFGIYHYNSCIESTFVLQTRQKVFKEVSRTPGSENGIIEAICYKPIRVYKASGSCDAGEIWVKCRYNNRTDNIMQMHLYNVIAVPSFNPLNQYAAFNQNTSEHLMWVWENQHSDFEDYSPIGPWLDNKPTAIDSSANTAILDCQMIPDEQEVEPVVPTTSITLTDSAPTYTVDENSDSVISVINNCENATGKVVLNTLEDNEAVTFVVDDSSIQDLTIEDSTQSPAETIIVEIGYSAIVSWNNTSEVWTVVAKSSDNTPVIEDYSNIEVNHVFHYDQIDHVSELETSLQIFVTPLSGVYHEEINEGDLILMAEPVNLARLSESDCGVDAGVYVIDKVEADQNFEVSSIIISKVAGVDKLNNIVGKNSGKFTEEGYWKVIDGSIRKVYRQTDEVFAAHNEQPECPGEVVAIPIIGDAEAIASIEISDKYKTNVGVIIDCSDTVIEFSEDEWYKHEVKKLTFNTIMIDDNSGGYILNSKYNGKTCAIKFYVKVGDREPVLRTLMILLTAANILPTINNIFNHFVTVYVLNASGEQSNGYTGHEHMNVLLSSYDNPVNLVDAIAPTTSIDASAGYTVDGTEDNAVNISNTSGSTQTVTLPTGGSALAEAKTIIFVVSNGSDDLTFTDGVQSVTANAGEQVTCSWDTSEWTVVAKEYQEEESSTPSLHLDLQAHRLGSVVKSGDTYFLSVDTYTELPSVGEYVCARQAYSGAKKGIYQLTQVNPNNMIGVLITAISDISTVTITNDTEALNGVYMAIGDEFVKVPDESELSEKQDKLVSGVNIKTVNGQSLLGSGNISISGGGGILAASFVLYNLDGQITTVASQAYPLTLTAKFPQLGGRDWLSPNQTTGIISFTGAGVYKIEGGLGLTASSTNRVVRVKFSVLNNGVEVQGQTVNIGDTTSGGSGGNPSVVAIPSFEVLIESGWTLKIEFSTDTQTTITFNTTSSSIVITKTAEIS